tara:strand:- start:99 stop:446 length:348 start_codon:yes stop_codon:yes gene_type:complete
MSHGHFIVYERECSLEHCPLQVIVPGLFKTECSDLRLILGNKSVKSFDMCLPLYRDRVQGKVSKRGERKEKKRTRKERRREKEKRDTEKQKYRKSERERERKEEKREEEEKVRGK